MLNTTPPDLSQLPGGPPDRRGWPWTEAPPALPPTMPNSALWPRISIVTPSFNQGHYIEETIRAILLQGYPNLEYIIAEDASTDNTAQILKKYEPWLRVLWAKENGGMSSAINRGFAESTGDIITWISSDDVYLPGAFEQVGLQADQLADYGVIVGAFHFVDAESRQTSGVIHPRLPHAGPIDLSVEGLHSWRLHQVATFFTRHGLDDVGRYVREDIRHNPDREILYRLAQRHKVLLLDQPLAAFRQHDSSKSWSISNLTTMAREYASIHLMFLDNDARANRRRRQVARQRIAKGYVHFAKYSDQFVQSLWALVRAVMMRPSLIRSRNYVLTWLKVFRLDDFARRFRASLSGS